MIINLLGIQHLQKIIQKYFMRQQQLLVITLSHKLIIQKLEQLRTFNLLDGFHYVSLIDI